MTEQEDKMFLDILDDVDKMDIPEDVKGAEIIDQLTDLYLDLNRKDQNPRIIKLLHAVYPEKFV